MVLFMCVFDLPVWPLQYPAGSWRIIRDYHKLNQVVAMPDVPYLLQQINIASGTWHAAIDLENELFFIPVRNSSFHME